MWNLRAVSVGPSSLPQATQGSHRQKDPKVCHQKAVTKAQENQTPQEVRPIISQTKAGPEKEEGQSNPAGRNEKFTEQREMKEREDMRSTEEMVNALNLPVHHIEPNKKIAHLNTATRGKYIKM